MTGEVCYVPDWNMVSIEFFPDSVFIARKFDRDEKVVKSVHIGYKEYWKTQEITDDCQVDWIGGDTLVHVQLWDVKDGVVTLPANLPQREEISSLLQAPQLAELGLIVAE